jgi:chloramphenicol-sensitive protein RarD
VRRGLFAALGAFAIWGALPLYLRPLRAVPALTIISHRLVWCCAVVCSWLAFRGELGAVTTALRRPATRARLIGSALLISCNWLVYVWAVGNGHVVDASLGYFVNPLVNVLLGVLLLRERLRPVQWLAVALALSGVVWLAGRTHHLPWIALTLAFTFSGYGLLRKVVAVDALAGLATETALLLPFGLSWLVAQQLLGPGAFGGADLGRSLWLMAGGVVTAVPLALFAFGARRIRYSTVGILQYVAPSLQLFFGIFLFEEPFPPWRAAGFAMIWAALAVYSADALWYGRIAGGRSR